MKDPLILGKISWKGNSLDLKKGKYYIGNTEHSHIYLDEKGTSEGLAASITIDEDNFVFRCIGDSLSIRKDVGFLKKIISQKIKKKIVGKKAIHTL